METNTLHLPTDLAHIIGYGLMCLTLLWLIGFALLHGRSIINELKGDNGKWDAPEVIIVIWLFIFPVMVICSVFLGFNASPEAWYSMDAIMLFTLGGKVGLEHVRKPGKQDDQRTPGVPRMRNPPPPPTRKESEP